MRVLIVGGGGREHALVWAATRSGLVSRVYAAPGNAGISLEAGATSVGISADNVEALAAFALDNRIDLAIVGPEAPLTLGITDRFRDCAIRCFGPSAEAAQLEGSKDFTKRFLRRHGIPSAQFETFTDIAGAYEYIERRGAPIVVKADGLAAGKGVVVAKTVEQAKEAATDMLTKRSFGPAGDRIIIEDCLIGEEASYICIVDGEDVLSLATSQDHKAVYDGDMGPNTGGMGAVSPAPIVDHALERRILEEIIRPTVKGLSDEGVRYTGFLYAGLMIDDEGHPQVLEYNCRLGDPETQPLMVRLKTDLIGLILAAIEGRLATVSADWDDRIALGVVVAAKGYPGKYTKGALISMPDLTGIEDVNIFHAATEFDASGALVATGGRILCVTAAAPTVRQAQARAYETISQMSMDRMHYRTDIGNKALDYFANN